MTKRFMPVMALAALAAMRPTNIVGVVHFDVDPEATLKEVSQKLDALNGEIKQTAESALKQAKDAGAISAETKETADKLLRQQTDLQNSVQSLTQALESNQAELMEVSQVLAAGGRGGGSAAPMSLGKAVVADQGEKLKAFLANGCAGALTLNIQNAITTAATSGGGLIEKVEEREPVRRARRRLRVRDMLTQATTGIDAVHYIRQNVTTDGTGMVAETVASAETAMGFTKVSDRVKKIATHTNVSEEALGDADQLQSEIDGELRYLLDKEEEEQILAGDGVGENFTGLLTLAPAFVAPAGLPNATPIDRLRLGILLVTLEDYIPMEMILNPLDWTGIDLVKDANAHYVYGNPGAATSPMLWGKDVVESNSMSGGEWLVGDLMMAATYYDRQMTDVILSTEHDTNFIEDMVTIKARKRAALAGKRPLAMRKGNFTFA